MKQISYGETTCVQFFFNETKSKDEVSRFWLWDSHRENPVGDVEKRLPYLPQDRRSRSDPYLGIPLDRRLTDFVAQPSRLFASHGSFFSSRSVPPSARSCY